MRWPHDAISTSSFQLWRVVGTAARVTVLGPGGGATMVPSGAVNVEGATAPQAGGTLVLAEPAGGWRATLGGHPLTPLSAPVNGWAQGFHLPAGGGPLSVTRNETGRRIAVGEFVLQCFKVPGFFSEVQGDNTARVNSDAHFRPS